MTGTIAQGAPSQNQGAPSAAGLVIGTPSPTAPGNTGYQPVGNSSSFSDSFIGLVSSMEKTAVGAVTGLGNQVKYKADKVIGTVQKQYYQTVAGAYGAVATGGQAVETVAKKVTQVSSLLVFGIIAFLAFPYIMAMRKK